MNRTLLALVLVAPLALGAAACAAELTVDGYPVAYVERPILESHHRRYTHHGVTVYEVNGRYYREHNGRWIVYHERPRELIEVTIR
jgi:hypothetical protein